MRAYGKFVLNTLVAGFLVLAPIYLAALLLLRALKLSSSCAADRQGAPGIVACGTVSCLAAHLDSLLPYRGRDPYSDRARDLGANRSPCSRESPARNCFEA